MRRADAGLELERWLEAGHHGTMGWMEERAHHRVSPLALWPEARSAIALGDELCARRPIRWRWPSEPELGRISVYAQGGDYHKTVKKALKALARFIVDAAPCELKVFVDTAPVMEKPLAPGGGHRLAGQAHQPASAASMAAGCSSASSSPASSSSPTRPPTRHALRQLHALPRRLPDAGVRRRRTGSMRGAAFPTSRSSMTGRSRTNSARRSATASTAATIAWRSARGTASPRRRRPTAPSCRAPSLPRRALADLLALDDAGVPRAVRRLADQAHRRATG